MTVAFSTRTAGTAARPVRRVGAASPGGLALPAATPTAAQLYSPRGVWTDGHRLVVADSGNHRVLIWHSPPAWDGAPADVVLGQPDFTSEGPAAGGRDVRRGLHLPTGVTVVAGDLVVADAWHHRVLRWRGLPEEHFAAAEQVLGQPDATSVAPNRGQPHPDSTSFYWPFGIAVVAGMFWVADTGNRRVLGWSGEAVPEPGRPADVLLGQHDATDRADNAGALGGATFRWPHALAGDATTLLVADAGDHRVLGWSPPPRPGLAGGAASLVLGQPDLATAEEFAYRPQTGQRLRFPYAVAGDSSRLVVADTSNNRVLIWHGLPRAGAGVPADTVLAQPDQDAHGENRWSAVSDDSLCWPYGLSLAGDVLAIADSGNNRVMLWTID